MNDTSQPERESDSWLISRCQAGEVQAFGVLVEKYKQRAYYTALGLVGAHEDALDISQEAFVRAYRSVAKFQPDKSGFFTWYYKILRNLCANFLRDRAKHARPFSEIDESEKLLSEIPDENYDPTVIAERNELKDAVWRAISSLKAPEREIIMLRDFQEMSYKEIAEALDCPLGTVMSRLFNAREHLRKKLKEVTKTMQFTKPLPEVWDRYWVGIYNRLERGLGWIVFSIGCVILLTYGGFKAIEAIIADPQLELIVKIGIIAVIGGLTLLVVSVAREKIFTAKTDKYQKEVER